MSSAAEHLARAAEGLRADVRYLQKQIADGKTLNERQANDLVAKPLAAGILDQLSHEYFDVPKAVVDNAVITAVAASNWRRGRIMGLDEAAAIVHTRFKVARWWQQYALSQARAAIVRLSDHVRAGS